MSDLKKSDFRLWLCLLLIVVSGCQHEIHPTAHMLQAASPKIKQAPPPVMTPIQPWKPYLSVLSPHQHLILPWTNAQVRQLSIHKNAKAISFRWHHSQITIDKSGFSIPGPTRHDEFSVNEPPYVRQVLFSNGDLLSLPGPQSEQLPGRMPNYLILHHFNSVVGRLSMEQAFHQWIKEGLVSHATKNEMAYMLDSDALSGAVPSAQIVGDSALAVLEPYNPKGSGYFPGDCYLVRLMIMPQIMVLPLRHLDAVDVPSTGFGFSPRLYLLDKHLLLYSGKKFEAIQPDGKRFRLIARF